MFASRCVGLLLLAGVARAVPYHQQPQPGPAAPLVEATSDRRQLQAGVSLCAPLLRAYRLLPRMR